VPKLIDWFAFTILSVKPWSVEPPGLVAVNVIG
jgi:hypothetical protein